MHPSHIMTQREIIRNNLNKSDWEITKDKCDSTRVHRRHLAANGKHENKRKIYCTNVHLRIIEILITLMYKLSAVTAAVTMRCSVEKAIAAEGKRWVAVLIEEAWRLYLLMRHRAVSYQGKPKSVITIEGSRVQRRILARSGLARYSAPSVKKKAAVRLQTTWNKIHQQLVVLWMDNYLPQTLTRRTKALTQQRWPFCYCGMHRATGMVILARKSLNGVFLLLHACWGTPRERLHVSCTHSLLCETLGHRLTLFALCLPRDHIVGLSV